MIIGNREFDTKNSKYIMAILNVTPDSFSDGGRYNALDAALKHTEDMIAQGADIIDIGGESTRPGYTMISDEEEIERVVPVIEAVKKRFDIPISLDTYKSRVAQAGIEAGADLINDIWGFKYDENMAKVVSDNQVACCLMHNRQNTDYTDYVKNVTDDLKESVDIAVNAGVSKDKIMIDPGVGFAKSYEQNLEIIRELDRLKILGYPILLGTSKKSVIGLTLNVPADERVAGTVATTVIGAMKGAAFFRVHNVAENLQAIKMVHAIGLC